jgi:hypothetical protein
MRLGNAQLMGKYDVDLDELLPKLGDYGEQIAASCRNGAKYKWGKDQKTICINGFHITASQIFGSERGSQMDAEFDLAHPNWKQEEPLNAELQAEMDAIARGQMHMNGKLYYFVPNGLQECKFHNADGSLKSQKKPMETKSQKSETKHEIDFTTKPQKPIESKPIHINMTGISANDVGMVEIDEMAHINMVGVSSNYEPGKQILYLTNHLQSSFVPSFQPEFVPAANNFGAFDVNLLVSQANVAKRSKILHVQEEAREWKGDIFVLNGQEFSLFEQQAAQFST